MKLPRIVLLIMEILAVLMGFMSAIGGSCPAFNPERILETDPGEILKPSSIALHAVMSEYQWAFVIMNVYTYMAAFFTLIMIVALISRKKWFYTAALWTALFGCVTGLIPYLLVTLNGGSTPSYMRAIIYGIVFLLLLIPAFRRELKDNIAVKGETGKGSSKKHLPALLFIPGALIWIQSYFAAPSHVLGNNVNMYQSLQIGAGLVLMAIGILVFTISKIKELRK